MRPLLVAVQPGATSWIQQSIRRHANPFLPLPEHGPSAVPQAKKCLPARFISSPSIAHPKRMSFFLLFMSSASSSSSNSSIGQFSFGGTPTANRLLRLRIFILRL
uniref:Uncharacterized protein n=1 Tax=Eutreptiella gymnastica TaxID=73025 RepID=A0A6T2BX64_9EUGL